MKKLIAVFVILVLTLIPESCLRRPLSVEDVESFVKENWNDIVLVNDYLLKQERVILLDDDGSIFIDFVDQRIDDDTVMEAIRSLWREGCVRITKFNEDNAIQYKIWRRDPDGVNCGFVYAIDHTQLPEVQYQIEITPLTIEGWYYYLEDFEKWRVENKE